MKCYEHTYFTFLHWLATVKYRYSICVKNRCKPKQIKHEERL